MRAGFRLSCWSWPSEKDPIMKKAISPKIAVIVNSSLRSKSYENLRAEGLRALLPKDNGIKLNRCKNIPHKCLRSPALIE